jgi:acyl-CoA thioester hydrolase
VSRVPAWRLDPAAYPDRQVIQTRFQDLDTLGHLNNVAFAALFETARVRFNRAGDLWTLARRRAVVAQANITYLAEGSYPADVEVATGIGRVGNRSWEVLALMTQDGRPVATCDVTVVMAAGEGGEGLPDDFRAALAGLAVRGGG